MAFTVEIAPAALEDIDAIVDYIHRDSPKAASRWRASLFAQLSLLQEMPRACPIAAENTRVDFELRHLIYGNYRLLFGIRGQTVRVVAVRHAARRYLTREELRGLGSPEEKAT